LLSKREHEFKYGEEFMGRFNFQRAKISFAPRRSKVLTSKEQKFLSEQLKKIELDKRRLESLERAEEARKVKVAKREEEKAAKAAKREENQARKAADKERKKLQDTMDRAIKSVSRAADKLLSAQEKGVKKTIEAREQDLSAARVQEDLTRTALAALEATGGVGDAVRTTHESDSDSDSDSDEDDDDPDFGHHGTPTPVIS